MKRNLWLVLALMMLLLAACGGAASEATVVDPAELGDNVDVKTVNAIKDRDDVLVIDVREQWEYDEGHIPGVTLIPMNEISTRLNELPTDKEIVVTCRSGNRSGQVADFLRDQGFDNVHNMTGGIVAWENAGLTVER